MLKHRNIQDVVTSGTTAPLRAGQEARREWVLGAMTNADKLLGHGPRTLARVGLHGEAAQQVGSTPTLSPTQTYPKLTDSRIALRAKCLLTPGCFPRVSAIVLPAGATQEQLMGVPDWTLDLVAGWIDITATFTAGGSETVTHTIALPASEEAGGAEGSADGWAWEALRRLESPILAPVGALWILNLQPWCEGVTCEITIAYRGGVRVVDLVVTELPIAYAREVGVDTVYSAPLAVGGGGEPPAEYPSEYPLEATSATNPTFGSALLADVVELQHRRLGPLLAPFSGWRESQSVAALAAVGVSATSLTFVNLVDTTLTTWSSASPGWSISAGGQAQQVLTSEPRRITRDLDACTPVRCWIYGARTGSGTATVRLQSEDYAIAEVEITSSTDGWWSGTGHLRCGLGPEDPSVLQLLGKLAVAGTLTVRHFILEYLDT